MMEIAFFLLVKSYTAQKAPLEQGGDVFASGTYLRDNGTSSKYPLYKIKTKHSMRLNTLRALLLLKSLRFLRVGYSDTQQVIL